MNIGLIFAGGTGQRMNSGTKPKQFLELHGKPIIIYTLELFENHKDIDGIVVVCVEGWIDYLKKLIDKFGITKVKTVVKGGETGQGSIRNGVYAAKELYPSDSVILIHDGVRPLINEKIISDCIDTVHEKGNAITVSPAIETIIVKDGDTIDSIVERSKCQMARAPQCFILGDICKVHEDAEAKGRNDYIDSACLMRDYGHVLHTVEGCPENIKITTPSDFYIFRAIIDARENSQIFG